MIGGLWVRRETAGTGALQEPAAGYLAEGFVVREPAFPIAALVHFSGFLAVGVDFFASWIVIR